MDRLDDPARLMIVSDLDCTMVDHDDPENLALLRFNALWESEYRHNSLLVFSTGRSPALYKLVKEEVPLLTPDVTILSVGTEIFYGDSMVPDRIWEQNLKHKWDREVVMEETAKFPQLSYQSPENQRPYKVSFYIEKDFAEEVMKFLSQRLASRGLDVKILYSSGIALDVLPLGAGKGKALEYLLNKLKSDRKLPVNTLVCGDSGNDAELFTVPEVHGVVVSNAYDELIQWYTQNSKEYPMTVHATERCAAGIIQAIGHFGLGPNVSPRDVVDFSNHGHEVVMFYLMYERWRRAEVENTDLTLQNMKSICHPSGIAVHPSGFERSLIECMDSFSLCYGDKRGKNFRVWVDRVSTSQISSVAWLVRFYKWELSDKGRHCCLTTVLLNSKNETPGVSVWVHVHQTWLDGYAAIDQSNWIF